LTASDGHELQIPELIELALVKAMSK